MANQIEDLEQLLSWSDVSAAHRSATRGVVGPSVRSFAVADRRGARYSTTARIFAGVAVAAVGTAVWYRGTMGPQQHRGESTLLETMSAADKDAVTSLGVAPSADGAKLEASHSAAVDGPPLAAGTSMRSDGVLVEGPSPVNVGGGEAKESEKPATAEGPKEAPATVAQPAAQEKDAPETQKKEPEQPAKPAETPASQTPAEETPEEAKEAETVPEEKAKEEAPKEAPAKPSGGYLETPTPESKLEEVLAGDKLGWQCHDYVQGQDDAWCRKAGIIGDMEYKYVDADGECGFCHCCEKKIDASSASWSVVEAAMKAGQEAAAKAPEGAAKTLGPSKVSDKYSHEQAVAFAALTKLAGCGTESGIFAAVAASCSSSEWPGASGLCAKAGISVTPGKVLAYALSEGSSFYAAEVSGAADSFPLSVVLAFAGEEPTAKAATTDGPVDSEYLSRATTAMPQVRLALSTLGCSPRGIAIHLTGRGAGAAVAQLVAWELKRENYTVGTSYVFGSPNIGVADFGKEMKGSFDGKDFGPIFNIVHGKSQSADGPYKPWGYQVHYGDDATEVGKICDASEADCGAGSSDGSGTVCQLPFAHDGDLCEFKDKLAQCSAGLPL